jgi:hypothetical protein
MPMMSVIAEMLTTMLSSTSQGLDEDDDFDDIRITITD